MSGNWKMMQNNSKLMSEKRWET